MVCGFLGAPIASFDDEIVTFDVAEAAQFIPELRPLGCGSAD